MTENWNIDNEGEKEVKKYDKNHNLIGTTVADTTPPAEKYPLPTGMLGSSTKLELPKDPSILETILHPENKPQLDINNLLATVPDRPLSAGYYTPIHNDPTLMGYTEGQMPIFGAAANIFPMGLWDERRRSLLNAYQQRQAQIGQAVQPNFWESDKTAAELQGAYNQAFAEEGNALSKEAAATGNIGQLSRPDLNTSFGKKVQAFHDKYKKIAALGIYAVDQANNILKDPKADQWQVRIANKLKFGDMSDIQEAAKTSELLYKIGNYDATLQDRADALMRGRDIQPVTEEQALAMNIDPKWKEIIRSGNGAGVLKYLTFQKVAAEGKIDNVALRTGDDFGDMYEAKAGRKLTPEEKASMAKEDIRAYVGNEIGVGTTGFNQTNNTFNYNEAKKKPTVMEDYRNFQINNDVTIKKELRDISSMVAYDLTTKGVSIDTPEGQKEAIATIKKGMNKLSETLTVDGQRWFSPSTENVTNINAPAEMDIFTGALPNLNSDRAYLSFEEIINSQENETVKNDMRAELKKAGIPVGTKIPVTLTEVKAAFLNKNTRKSLRYKDMIPGAKIGEKTAQNKWTKGTEYNANADDYNINFDDYNPSVALHYTFTFDKDMINQLTKGSESLAKQFQQLTGGVFGKNVYSGVKYSDLRSNPDMVTLNSLFEADASPQYPTSTNYRKAIQ
jgi:hypothetical protein